MTHDLNTVDRYTFGVHSLGLLAATRASLERFGFTCMVEVATVHGFELHTLVATPAPHPNRAARGCGLPTA